MKQQRITTLQEIDFEVWLGYEFWALQAEAESDHFNVEAEKFSNHMAVMEIRNPYQATQLTEEQRECGNDALPF